MMTSDVQNAIMGLYTSGGEFLEAYKKFNFDHYFNRLFFGDASQHATI